MTWAGSSQASEECDGKTSTHPGCEPELARQARARDIRQNVCRRARCDAGRRGQARNIGLDIRYTNLEGEAINWVYDAATNRVDGLLMNPAGFTVAGYALRDCLKAVRDSLPYVEIHISNIDKRGIKSVTAEAAEGVVQGFGLDSYFVALDAMLRLLARKEKLRG
jgi:3-dehydroquinate dehydratase II